MLPLISCLFLSLFLLQVSESSTAGTEALTGKILTGYNDECTMTDLGVELINDRASTCAQGQTGFFNGERRSVNSGVGIYPLDGDHIQNGYELTSCACAQNGTWTRTFARVDNTLTSSIRWTWRFYARKADCTLELKRSLMADGCWIAFAEDETCECPEGYVTFPRVCDCQLPFSPVVIDLEGDGIRYSSRAEGVQFDLDGNGTRGQVPWTGDAWLVLNDRQDFYVVDGRQFFGDRSPQPNDSLTPNGYTALSVFDDNHDQLIDSRDGVWPLLAVWRDANWNGISNFGEVVTLDAAGVAAIDLRYRESRQVDQYGNEFRYRSKVTVKGKERWSYDVFLSAL